MFQYTKAALILLVLVALSQTASVPYPILQGKFQVGMDWLCNPHYL
jgi:hypothetical protein